MTREEIVKRIKEEVLEDLNPDSWVRNRLENIFPELVEFEDDKIITGIESIIKYYKDKGETVCPYPFVSLDECLAWLEKQGEQKPTDKVEPKFKVGDWIVTNKNHIWYVDENPETTSYLYMLINQYGKVEVAEFEVVDNVARLWTIQDAKDGDVLCLYYNNRKTFFIFKAIIGEGDYADILVHCCYTGKYQYLEPSFNGECRMHQISDGGYCLPADKEEQDILFQKMKETGYEWDAEKKELRKIEQSIDIPFGTRDSELQEATYYIPSGFHVEIDGNKVVIKKGNQKPAWSEEDECIYQSIIDDTVQENQLDSKQIDWLKSLKDRVQLQNKWKPSKDQIIALRWVLNNIPYNKHKEEISGLLDQIKVL